MYSHRLEKQSFSWVACVLLVLAMLPSLAHARGAGGEAPERRSFARIDVALVDVQARPIGSSTGPGTVVLDRVLDGHTYSFVDERYGNGERVEELITWAGGQAFPWQTGVVAGTARAAASMRDGWASQASASGEVTGDAWPWHRAAAGWWTYALLLLSPQTELTMTLHVTGDSSGRDGEDLGAFGYRFSLVSEDLQQVVRRGEEGVLGPYDEFVTLSVVNTGADPMGVFWSSEGNIFVTVTPAVPEPASVSMLGAGLLLMLPVLGRRLRGIRARRAP